MNASYAERPELVPQGEPTEYSIPVLLNCAHPAVDVARDSAPVVPLMVRADVDVVAVPASVVVER